MPPIAYEFCVSVHAVNVPPERGVQRVIRVPCPDEDSARRTAALWLIHMKREYLPSSRFTTIGMARIYP